MAVGAEVQPGELSRVLGELSRAALAVRQAALEVQEHLPAIQKEVRRLGNQIPADLAGLPIEKQIESALLVADAAHSEAVSGGARLPTIALASYTLDDLDKTIGRWTDFLSRNLGRINRVVIGLTALVGTLSGLALAIKPVWAALSGS